MRRRIRATWNEETPARSEGLAKQYAAKDGFSCECGTHFGFTQFVLDHWSDPHQIRCPNCQRLWRFKKGDVTLLSGPVRSRTRVVRENGKVTALANDEPLWRAYRRLNNGPRPATYEAVTGYHRELDHCNGEAWEYCGNAEPFNKNRREDLFRMLERVKEYPQLSQVQVNGKVVGSGYMQAVGRRVDAASGEDWLEFELRDPAGQITRIRLTKQVWSDIVFILEGEPK